MIQNYDHEVQTSYTYLFFLFSHCLYIIFLIGSKSWNCIHWLLLFLIRIKFAIPMSKTACLNPWQLTTWIPNNLNIHHLELFFLPSWTFNNKSLQKWANKSSPQPIIQIFTIFNLLCYPLKKLLWQVEHFLRFGIGRQTENAKRW